MELMNITTNLVWKGFKTFKNHFYQLNLSNLLIFYYRSSTLRINNKWKQNIKLQPTQDLQDCNSKQIPDKKNQIIPINQSLIRSSFSKRLENLPKQALQKISLEKRTTMRIGQILESQNDKIIPLNYDLYRNNIRFYRKQNVTTSTHQLVNLSNNPVEESQSKIPAGQISFVLEKSHSNDQTIIQNDERNDHDVTLETIPNKPQSALRSPQMGANNNQNQEEQFILQEECKTTPSMGSPTPLSYKEGLLSFANIESIKLNDASLYAQEALEKLKEEIDLLNDQDEYIQNLEKIELYMSHYMNSKKMFLRIKFEFEVKTDMEKFLKWSNSNALFEYDQIANYNLTPLNEQLSVGEIILHKHLMIKSQLINYLKYVELVNQTYFIVYKSLRLDDRYETLISQRENQLSEGQIVLAGLKLSQKDKSLIVKGMIDADFCIKVNFNLTKKALKEKVCSLINKCRETLQ